MARLDRLFKMMVDEGVSDLHLGSDNSPMWRQHGEIKKLEGEDVITESEMLPLIKEIMPDMNYDEFLESNDTDFAYELEGVARFRANVFRDRKGPGAVFRVIPSKILTAEDLNLPKAILDLCFLSKGLVVVTGPTGSGKSTTLAAMVDFINRNRTEHIITIEDPVEFVHENKKCLINQREIHKHTKGFKQALRAALREDPDIVLVGEMRDLETVEIAIETAETGHLVFGTLHTSTAASTVERIIQQFPGEKQEQIRQMLSGSLKGVVSQTLLKNADGKGRSAALEILIVNNPVAAQIREGKTFQIASTMQTSANIGMTLLNDELLKLVVKGKVAPSEAFLKAIDKKDMIQKFENSNIRFDPDSVGGGASKAEEKPVKKRMPMDDDMGGGFARKSRREVPESGGGFGFGRKK